MTFSVLMPAEGLEFWLKGRGMTRDPDEADEFDSEEEAQAALDAIRDKIMPNVYNNASIEEFE